jgi:hypothetical protein
MTDVQELLRYIFVGIHGWSGAGKTWLIQSLPRPLAYLDFEHGGFDAVDRDDLPTNIVTWDPVNEPPPTGMDDTTVVVVNCTDPNRFDAVMTHLRGVHAFKSASLDSYHALQERTKRRVANRRKDGSMGPYDPNSPFQQAAWGRLKNNGELLFDEMRDMASKDSVTPMNWGVVIGSDTEVIPAVPLVEGGLRRRIPYFFDVLGYLYTVANPEDPDEEVRVLQIAQDDIAVAKTRIHKIKLKHGRYIDNPNLSDLVTVMNTPKEELFND